MKIHHFSAFQYGPLNSIELPLVHPGHDETASPRTLSRERERDGEMTKLQNTLERETESQHEEPHYITRAICNNIQFIFTE